MAKIIKLQRRDRDGTYDTLVNVDQVTHCYEHTEKDGSILTKIYFSVHGPDFQKTISVTNSLADVAELMEVVN